MVKRYLHFQRSFWVYSNCECHRHDYRSLRHASVVCSMRVASLWPVARFGLQVAVAQPDEGKTRMRVEDKRSWKLLLIDTIRLFCQNGLQYTKRVKIDGLIAVTLDDGEVIVTSISKVHQGHNDVVFVQKSGGAPSQKPPVQVGVSPGATQQEAVVMSVMTPGMITPQLPTTVVTAVLTAVSTGVTSATQHVLSAPAVVAQVPAAVASSVSTPAVRPSPITASTRFAMRSLLDGASPTTTALPGATTVANSVTTARIKVHINNGIVTVQENPAGAPTDAPLDPTVNPRLHCQPNDIEITYTEKLPLKKPVVKTEGGSPTKRRMVARKSTTGKRTKPDDATGAARTDAPQPILITPSCDDDALTERLSLQREVDSPQPIAIAPHLEPVTVRPITIVPTGTDIQPITIIPSRMPQLTASSLLPVAVTTPPLVVPRPITIAPSMVQTPPAGFGLQPLTLVACPSSALVTQRPVPAVASRVGMLASPWAPSTVSVARPVLPRATLTPAVSSRLYTIIQTAGSSTRLAVPVRGTTVLASGTSLLKPPSTTTCVTLSYSANKPNHEEAAEKNGEEADKRRKKTGGQRKKLKLSDEEEESEEEDEEEEESPDVPSDSCSDSDPDYVVKKITKLSIPPRVRTPRKIETKVCAEATKGIVRDPSARHIFFAV